MKNTLETRLGIFFALAIIASILTLEMVGGTDYFKGGYHLHALFNNVQELKEGALVKMAGFPIGRVEQIRPAENKIRVTLKINRGQTVRTDSKAVIKFTGLMGENFVSLDFGTPTAPPLLDDQTLTTAEQPDLSTLMAKLEDLATGVEGLTKNFSGESLQNLVGPFTDFLKENSPRLTAILGNMQNISSQIAEGKGTVGKLIADDQLYRSAVNAITNLENVSGDVRGLIGKAQTIIDQVNTGQGTLGKLAKDEALYTETTTAMTNMKEILQKINQGQGSVGKLVNDESFFKNIKMTLQKVEKATEGLEDQGPLSVLGILANSLF